MTAKRSNARGTRYRAKIALAALATLLLAAMSSTGGLAQRADARASAQATRGGPTAANAGEARASPGQQMLRQVLRDAFPKPQRGANRLSPSDHPRAEIPARNSVGLMLPAPARTINASQAAPTPAPAVTMPSAAVVGGAPGLAAKPVLRQSAPVYSPAAVAPAAPQRVGINGTAMVRSGSGPTAIGGPARSTTGINGTGMQTRQGN